jgi:hypothetical protein
VQSFASQTQTAQFKSSVSSGGSTAAFLAESTGAAYSWNDLGVSTANGKLWDAFVGGGAWTLRLVKDDNSAATAVMTVTRVGMTINAVAFGGPVNANAGINVTGSFYVGNDTGGGYGGAMQLAYNGAAANNPAPNKYFRVSPAGTLEIVNSAYSAVLFQVSDIGDLTATRQIAVGSGYAFTSAAGAQLYLQPTGTAGGTNINFSGGSGTTNFFNGSGTVVANINPGGMTVQDMRVQRTVSGAPTTGVVYFGTGNNYLYYDGGTFFFNGGPVYIPTTVTAATVVATALSLTGGGTMTAGQMWFQGNGNTLDSGDGTPLQVRNDGTYGAFMSFHRTGAYAIKLGLDQNNTFCLGGWSQGNGATRVYWDTAGNQVTAGIVRATSDLRTKKDMAPILDVVEKITSIDAFTYTDKASGERRIGVSAQSVHPAFPEAVAEGKDGMLAVGYGNLALAALVEYVKVMEVRMARLEALVGHLG